MWEFQSTLPLREATRYARYNPYRCDFNPHSPCGERRGWRCRPREGGCNFNPHSPCGERPAPYRRGTAPQDFNPHSPCGERLSIDDLLDDKYLFQSTLPLRGATGSISSPPCLAVISIHTPLAGSDRPARGSRLPRWHFNPHSPCGERRHHTRCNTGRTDFNPHSPCGERPQK